MSMSEVGGRGVSASPSLTFLLGLLFRVTVRYKFHELTAGPFFRESQHGGLLSLGSHKKNISTMAKDQKKAAKKGPLVKKIAATALRSHVGERARYVIKTAQTLAPEIVFSFCCRKNEESSSGYIKPLVDHFNQELENGNNDIARE